MPVMVFAFFFDLYICFIGLSRIPWPHGSGWAIRKAGKLH